VVEPPTAERWLARVFGDAEATGFGSGWIAGTASVFLGTLSVLAVAAFRFPGVFSTAGFREHYPLAWLRALLGIVIGVGFLLGALSMVLRRRKVLGVTGIVLALLATLGGGSRVPVDSTFDQPLTIGLDWFVLNVLLLSLVFVPLERAFPLRREQTTFRSGWTTDGLHFLVSHLAVQGLTFMTLLPATSIAALWQPASMRALVVTQPGWLQLLEIVLLADLWQYWVHRAFHVVPWLWRIHAIHHSSRTIDWLAGSRLHVVDVIATRSLVLVPIFLLGFATGPLYAYLVLVSFHAVFLHANVRFRFGVLDRIVATPRGHHWHHAVAPIDKNFAVHLPVLDALFGTLHLPGDAWPAAYGIDGDEVPEGWGGQLVYPFRRHRTPGP
jgi:sterol desaturase/sphingolipid hydroxylase (fatty acid hydroxylase superfamily)